MSYYDDEELEKFRLSGKILRETREEIKNFVHEEMPIIEICQKAESLILEKDGKPAFPCNVSVNELAAHYSSPPGDTKKIPRKSIVKVDLGVHIDGYLTDTAVTVCFNSEYNGLIETAESALETAINCIQPKIRTAKIGSAIEEKIVSLGFKPISNLTGHQVGRYLVHAGTSIPNVSQASFSTIKLGRVYAIEPFVTLPNAIGKVENGKETTIFRFLKSRSLQNPYAKKLRKYIEDNFRTLPFSERWLQGIVPDEQYAKVFKELLTSKTITSYPTYIEMSRQPVAQAEHTVLVVEDGCIVLT